MNWIENNYGYWAKLFFDTIPLNVIVPVFVAFIIWSLVWKGMALWKAAHNRSAVWFVVLLLVNTLGILEILYIFVFGKKSDKTDL
ncbi:MAG: hypothetical protein UX74_C0031G0021 [Parcubacteria group bacterium GW2011_GWA2_47_10b]|nr:MAG: hypothetical protein UX74_C0031G0021 [Parcubacteria group bacterium GW2011_GWA2_47_10b]KKU85643.1 MAG: hypothetical protein UY14_C0017G0006 [Parcubacteria group bacterium GW2011_GWA1_47_9]